MSSEPPCPPERLPQVAQAEQDFHAKFNTHCTKTLNPEARGRLAWLFENTIRRQICRGGDWDEAAKKYVLPKVGELASQVQGAAEDPATGGAIMREAEDVVRRHRPVGILAWCDGVFVDDAEPAPAAD